MILKREDVTKEINKLLFKYTIEDIAVKCGVCANTVYKWSKGRSCPMVMAGFIRKIR